MRQRYYVTACIMADEPVEAALKVARGVFDRYGGNDRAIVLRVDDDDDVTVWQSSDGADGQDPNDSGTWHTDEPPEDPR